MAVLPLGAAAAPFASPALLNALHYLAPRPAEAKRPQPPQQDPFNDQAPAKPPTAAAATTAAPSAAPASRKRRPEGARGRAPPRRAPDATAPPVAMAARPGAAARPGPGRSGAGGAAGGPGARPASVSGPPRPCSSRSGGSAAAPSDTGPQPAALLGLALLKTTVKPRVLGPNTVVALLFSRRLFILFKCLIPQFK